ncbi:hypothetical protein INR49_007621, partial [Caranx melampygus]
VLCCSDTTVVDSRVWTHNFCPQSPCERVHLSDPVTLAAGRQIAKRTRTAPASKSPPYLPRKTK